MARRRNAPKNGPGEIPRALAMQIVARHACYHSVSDIVRWLQEEHEREVHHSTVSSYNPTTVHGRTLLAGELKSYFYDVRAAWEKEREKYSMASRGFRLEQLLELYQEARQARNFKLAAALLEQAAREEGGMFRATRRTEVTGANGAPLMDLHAALAGIFHDVPDEELDKALNEFGAEPLAG